MALPKNADLPKISRTVWTLGLVSMFMDISSEIVHALLPLFLTVTLGTSVALVGVIDGIAEATASISKVFSGYLSDRIGRRKPLILLGYGLGALSKPLFALAAGPVPILGARLIDRIGKGLRGAPRDALVADVTPLEIRGRAYGLRQALDTVGAFAGPLAAIGLMAIFSDDMRAVFWVAVIPGLIAVLLVIFGIEGHRDKLAPADARVPLRIADLRKLERGFWLVVCIGVMFTMAQFSEAFLILKANEDGLPLALAPLVLVVMNVVYHSAPIPLEHSPTMGGATAIVLRPCLLCRRRHVPGIAAGHGRHLYRDRAMGRSYGADPGIAGSACRRTRARGIAGIGLWHIQSCHWYHDACRQRARRGIVGSCRTVGNIHRRRWVCRTCSLVDLVPPNRVITASRRYQVSATTANADRSWPSSRTDDSDEKRQNQCPVER